MSITNNATAAPHIGSILKTFLNSKNRTGGHLARALNINATCTYAYFKRPSMQVAQLWKISNAMGHNFFKDLAAKLPADFTSNVIPSTIKDDLLKVKDEQIAALQKENERLIMERDILKEVLKIK